MKTPQTLASAAAFDVFEAALGTARHTREAPAWRAQLRRAVADATEWMTGIDADVARTRCLSQATDPADLERRFDAWERTEATRRALPPVL